MLTTSPLEARLRPRRKVRPVLATVALIAVMSSCSVATKDAVRVNGESLSNQDFDRLVSGYSEVVSGAQVASGNVNMVAARGLLQDWINTIILEGALKEAGVSVTDEQREAARAGLSAQGGFSAAPVDVQDFYIRAASVLEAVGLAFAPDSDELAEIYNRGPIESGVVCLRLILTTSREEIDAAVNRISAGESFADVAAATSIDISAEDGGILTDQQTGSACVQQAELASQIVPEFVAALETAQIGVTTAPFEVPQVGWVVILLRPYEEVSSDVAPVLGPTIANRIGRAALAEADIWLSAEYGRWDVETFQIID